MTSPRPKVRRRLLAAFASAITFSGSTGNTQGVRFRIAPPTNATSSITAAYTPAGSDDRSYRPRNGSCNTCAAPLRLPG